MLYMHWQNKQNHGVAVNLHVSCRAQDIKRGKRNKNGFQKRQNIPRDIYYKEREKAGKETIKKYDLQTPETKKKQYAHETKTVQCLLLPLAER